MANESRAHRIWHIEQRYGYYYATNQYGGFTRHETRTQAEARIESDIATYGDRWATIATEAAALSNSETAPATADDEDEGHRLEDHGKVYFSLGPGETSWRLDSASVDGYPLDGGLDEIECTYGNRHMCQVCRSEEGHAELERASAVALPTGRELLDLLAEHYGYTLVARLGEPLSGGDPDRLLARFRDTLREIETEAAAYYANPANESDPQATATHVDRQAELLAVAVDAAVGLDAAASRGVRPQLWNHAQAA
ncbi:hypothetical protein [Nocardia asteroides]|uniref:hypothetical protein n=1 Tax=Nocardia asteroides TaxID=1824 RepID=UPI001E31416F|nr:hypothetical protein [Nocardia asteroides]UGT58845.1 hypothetical protein LTT85_33375 [Nocardia asteroides]